MALLLLLWHFEATVLITPIYKYIQQNYAKFIIYFGFKTICTLFGAALG